MSDIQEQIGRARLFATLCDSKSTHRLCGRKVTALVDTMEKLLAVYEAARKAPLSGIISLDEGCDCDDCTAIKAVHKAIAAVEVKDE